MSPMRPSVADQPLLICDTHQLFPSPSVPYRIRVWSHFTPGFSTRATAATSDFRATMRAYGVGRTPGRQVSTRFLPSHVRPVRYSYTGRR